MVGMKKDKVFCKMVWRFLIKLNISSVQFSRSVVPSSLWPHGLQHARPPWQIKHSPTIKSSNWLLKCLPNFSHFSSVAQSCPTLCYPMDCRTPGFPVYHQLPELGQTHVYRVSDAIQPSHLCCSLLLFLIFLSIRVFSNESVLCNRWPKYWSFSFSISPSNEYSGLISFRFDWFDLFAIQGTLKSIL